MTYRQTHSLTSVYMTRLKPREKKKKESSKTKAPVAGEESAQDKKRKRKEDTGPKDKKVKVECQILFTQEIAEKVLYEVSWSQEECTYTGVYSTNGA